MPLCEAYYGVILRDREFRHRLRADGAQQLHLFLLIVCNFDSSYRVDFILGIGNQYRC